MTEAAHTNLYVFQEKSIDDYWNVDANRSLSDSWKGFTKFSLLKEKPPKGKMWSGGRLTKIQSTATPEVWTKIGKAAQKKEKQGWAIEKPKLNNARRRMRKETTKHARRKLEVPMDAAMPCKKGTKKLSIFQETEAKSCESYKIPKTNHACIVEAHESTRQRLESLLPNDHEDHIAGKRYHLMSHYNLVHRFIPLPQAMKIADAKAVVDKEWEKLETIAAWQLDKVKSKKEGILESQRNKKKIHFATLTDICHLKNAELEPNFQTCKDRVLLRDDIWKDDSGAYAVLTDQGSSASQMTAAKVMDVIARLPDCDGQAAHAVSAFTQVKLGGRSPIAQKSKVRMF